MASIERQVYTAVAKEGSWGTTIASIHVRGMIEKESNIRSAIQRLLKKGLVCVANSSSRPVWYITRDELNLKAAVSRSLNRCELYKLYGNADGYRAHISETVSKLKKHLRTLERMASKTGTLKEMKTIEALANIVENAGGTCVDRLRVMKQLAKDKKTAKKRK